MQAKEAIRLLICAESQQEAETMTSLLRNVGHPTRALLINNLESLKLRLNEKVWDVCLCRMSLPQMEGKAVLAEIQKQGKDVPTIFIDDEVDSLKMERAIKQGAQDVVPSSEYNHLLQVVLRELKQLKKRRKLREAEALLRESEKRCQMLLESAQDAIAYIQDGMYLFANDSYSKLFGYGNPDDLITNPVMDMVSEKDHKKYKALLKSLKEGRSRSSELKCSMINARQEPFDTFTIFSRAKYEDESCTQVIVRPTSNNTELEAKLKQISSQDLLTGLYNKQYFIKHLADTVDKAIITEAIGAIAYINIDAFNNVKSTVGIEGADLVICDIAHLLRTKCREEDTVARIGEDIFGILLNDNNAEQAQAFAEHIRKSIEEHLIAVEQRTIQVTASIGLALINESSPNPKEVLQRSHEAADFVRKQDDRSNGNGTYLYNPAELANTDEERMQAKVVTALKNNGFTALYQPVISLRDEQGEHYETLLRLNESDGSEIGPMEFLNEQTADIKRRVDRWMILHTVKKLIQHRSQGNDTRIFVNLTNESLVDNSLLPWLHKLLQASKLPSGSLIAQFTESSAINHLKQAKEATHGLNKIGCKVAINRFGSAIDPFALLKHIHVDYVKVDGSFTQDLENQKGIENLKKILEGIQIYEKESIVPFVENANGVAQLWSTGVSFIQGYYLQGPVGEMNYQFGEE